MDRNNQTIQRGRPVSVLDASNANEYFELFLNATSLKHILGYYRGLIDNLHLTPNVLSLFYTKLRANLTSWRAKALWKKFDLRASHKCYQKGKLAANSRVLIIGGGPCGLRTAIEAQLLGAKVVVVEKRDRFSRNNVLHLWPFVIEDLRMLGAKKFFGKFCAGAIDHISIRQLQCILLKVALLLGVEVHTEVGFEKLIEPNAIEKTGWRAEFKPSNHPVSHYEFDVIIGADGKRNTLQGFTRKEFRGKLAIAITANFINKKSEAEARVEEISGVAFIFNQKFFKDLLEDTRIDLENIVYYKDDTHYFVMTAKKASLIEKGVIKQDLADTEKLLAPENVDREALQEYAIEAASFSTNYQMPNMEFAVNHYGQPDIAMFDFTSMYAAENASKVVERNGYRLLMILVGDSLLEPFWPTGSGCARGFLSALDAAWAIRTWSLGTFTPLDVIAERESIYRLLAQTTPDNLNKDWKSYTLDPTTRYPNLNKAVVLPHQVVCLYDSDNPASIDRMKRSSQEKPGDIPKKRRRGDVDNEVLLAWLSEQLREDEDIKISDLGSIFNDGKILCAIIHHYRPDLLDYNAVKDGDPAKNNQLAFDVLEKELGIPPVMTGEEITNTEDYLTMASYLTEVYDTFRGEIPHVKHPKLALPSKIPKPVIPIKIKSSAASHNLKNNCGNKLSDRSLIGTEAGNAGNSLDKQSSKTPCNVQNKNETLVSESKIEILYLKSKNSKRKLVEKIVKRHKYREPTNKEDISQKANSATDIARKPKQKKSRITNKLAKTKSNNSQYEQISLNKIKQSLGTGDVQRLSNSLEKLNIEEKCLRKIATEKNEKLKNFMSKLLLKRKKSRLKKCNLSVIPETKTDDFENKHNENGEETLIKVCNSTRTVIINENKYVKNTFELIHNDAVKSDDLELKNNFAQPEIPKHKFKRCSYKTKSLNNFPSNETLVKIRFIERQTKNKFTLQKIEFVSSMNQVTVSSKIGMYKIPRRAYSSQKRFKVPVKTKSKFNSRAEIDFEKHSLRINTSEGDGFDYYQQLPNSNCQINSKRQNRKFLSTDRTMNEGDGLPNQIYSRVSNWISSNDFLAQDSGKADTDVDTVISNSKITDISSVSKMMDQYDDVIVEERTDVVKFCNFGEPVSSQEKFAEKMKNVTGGKSIKTLSKFSQYSPFQNIGNLKSASAPPTQFSVIVEGEESELPESTKISELSFKTIKSNSVLPQSMMTNQLSRPSSRHKRHAEVIAPNKPSSIDRKSRKRRSIDKVGASVEERQKTLEEIASNRSDRQNRRRYHRKLQTEQFLKSMQMLQANAKPDSQPFEDYSIFLYRQTAPKFQDRVKDLEKQFTYIPDHDNKMAGQTFRGGAGTDEDLAARIKSLENKWKDPQPVDKKPKDLLRAIGKIETSDWNIKEIEKKIMENKLGKPSKAYDKEKVPKWSKEQFVARQTKMEKQHLDRQDSAEAKFADIDKSIKNLDQKLKEGTVRELGQNKVATITGKLVSKIPPDSKPTEKPTPRAPVALPAQGGSEYCHFCGKRVYLMERLSAEGRFFHHGCFKCQYCHTQLRLGSYAFDRDGQYGFKFYCLHHFGMVEESNPMTVTRKTAQKLTSEQRRSPENKLLSGIAGVDLLDKVQTPERIEFSNPSAGNVSSDHEESLSQMDEDEWTDKNFGASCAEIGDSDDDSSSLSDTDSDDEDAFDDAMEEPVTKEGTMKWAERWKNSYSRKRHNSESHDYSSSDRSSYYENSSDDDESDTATEGEEEIRARELRKQEVRVEPPLVQTDTGTDTEIVSDETTSDTSSEVHNSATEISTDSEFAQDEPTPTREIPSIILNDFHVTKTRGSGGSALKKIQVTTGYLQKPSSGKYKRPNIELKLKPLVPPSPIVKKPAPVLLPRTEGYALNRTQSTGGIAAKVSLELKKKYLLGEVAPCIQKSGSASTLDTKFKTFHTNISDCQKLLKPAPEISASMQTFCNKLDEIKSPVLSPQSSIIFPEEIISTPKNEDVPVAESEVPYIFENEPEGRPRSPVHETSIIVPQIDWSKKVLCLSSDSLASCSSENGAISQSKLTNIPRVEVHAAKDVDNKDAIPLDSLCVESQQDRSSVHSEPVKSITSEKKSLNQPKSLPDLDIALPDIHNILHLMNIPDDKNSSGLSSPESGGEQATAALTETELSDWARDEVVSDNFEDGEFESMTPVKKSTAKIAKMAEFDDMSHICGKNNEVKHKMIITEAMNSILSANLDIEFMDTGTETSSDDGMVDNSQSGYVLFKNEDEFAEDSLNPNVNEVVEATNVHVNEMKNTGYCVLANDDYNVVTSTVVDLKQSDLEKLTQNQSLNEHDEDSLVILETGTTTEENTFSDSTVKNVTEMKADKKQPALTENNNLQQKQRLEEKLAVVKAEAKIIHEQNDSNIAFEEHCQRLQSKIVFSNVKDSIDVRKSRRKSRPDVLQKPDLIQEECAPKDVTLTLTPASHTPDILYNKEVIKKERDDNQRLIQEMVMNKMKAENKSLERKKRTRTPLSPSSIYDLSKSATTDMVPRLNSDSLNKTAATPDVLLSANLVPLQNSKSLHTLPALNSSVAVYSSPAKEQTIRPQSVNSTLADDKLPESPMITVTPKAPPRQHRTNDDINRKLEKLKQTVRLRSQRNDNLDPHVQESIESLVINAERRNSWLYSNDTLNKKKNNSFRRSKSGDYQTPTSKTSTMSMSSNNLDLVLMRTKSIQEMPQNVQIKPIDYSSEKSKFCKSDPNILETDPAKGKKKVKDRERRKSISKLITTLFTKKSPGSSNSKGLFSKLSPKSKDVSKKMVAVEPVRRKSLSEVFIQRNAVTPPPIPPLPLNYIVKGTDESSEGEQDHRKHDYGSCDTLDQVEALENSTSSLTGPGRRSSKSARRASRQAQLKRHRMAQEIQRKLEETEVKTKELETRGVMVEKSLRGEDCSECSKDEPELLQEWFDLMRDRTELRRYERELTVRAQELELEDRHARLQHELRDRIENDKEKTEEDVKVEESIISEMIKIVEKRDSLIAEIEEDRIRYTCEDRDLEEQMLAKGLRLTPIKKSPEK